MKRRLEKIILEKTIPYTTVLITYKELDQSNTIFMDEGAIIEQGDPLQVFENPKELQKNSW